MAGHSHLSRSTIAALLLVSALAVPSPSLALTSEEERAVDLAARPAERMCTTVSMRGEAESSQVKGEIKAELQGLASKLADAGIAGSGELTSENYVNVLRSDLSKNIIDSNACRVRVLELLLQKVSIKPPTACRDATHGVDRYQREFNVTRESGWHGGGYSQPRWCEDVMSMLRGEHPQALLTQVSSGEVSRNSCAPANCPQYNYTCTVRVQTDPLYKEAVSSACSVR